MLEIEFHYSLFNTLQIYLPKLSAQVCLLLHILFSVVGLQGLPWGVHTINNIETPVKKLKQSDVAKSEISITDHLCMTLVMKINKWSCRYKYVAPPKNP